MPMPTPCPTRRSVMLALLTFAALLTTPIVALAQAPGSVSQQTSGPVISAAGPSFVVQEPTFATPARGDLKALFEINVGGGDTVKVNEQLVTMARFFNIHARNGVTESRLKAAAVIHGSGWTALLSDSAFAARFGGKPNPSRKLVEELLQHGAQLVLCGQTAGARNVRRDELLPGVKVSVSAMTAMIALQNDGYRFIPW
jgi:intracellular sulfur oxidation DsrE/DsrF family protein